MLEELRKKSPKMVTYKASKGVKFSPFLIGVNCLFSIGPLNICNYPTQQITGLSGQNEFCKFLNNPLFKGEKMFSINQAYEYCQAGKWTEIKQLAPFLSQLKDEKENTLFRLAIRCGDLPTIQKLLEYKIGNDEQDSQGNTPLHLATQLNLLEVIKLLLQKDNQSFFDANAQNKEGKTPSHLAIELGHTESLGLLLSQTDLKKQNGQNLLHWAVICQQFQIIDYLLTQHWSKVSSLIEERNSEGLTPLSLAARLGETQSLYILVKRGANLQAQDPQKNTPLHEACKNEHEAAIDCLVALGAQLTAFNKAKQKPQNLINQTTVKGKKIQAHLDQLSTDTGLAKISLGITIKNLVFQGGGPKGIAYIPALEDLENRQIIEHVERVAGASAGAITAALVAVGYSSADLKKELAEKIDGKPILIQFLDFPEALASESTELLKKAEKGNFSEIFQGGIWATTKKALALGWKYYWLPKHKKEALAQVWETGGLCPGDFFLNWIEAKIKNATGISHCTFGELRELINKKTPLSKGKMPKHLYIMATRIGDEPASLEFNSEDPKWDHLIISDAVRISMSIPFAFRPHTIHIKETNDSRKNYPEKGYFVDGGLLNNFPINVFDKEKYNPHSGKPESNNDWTNPHTIGFSLYTPKVPKTTLDHKISTVGKETVGAILDQEMILKIEKEKQKGRLIRINNQNIGLLEFNLSPEKETALLEEAQEQTKTFFKNYSLGRLKHLGKFYDYGLFKEREASGTLVLTPPTPEFLGRKQELEHLNQAILIKKSPFVSIIGPRGYGKSELAAAFACLNLSEFSLIFKIDYRNPESLEKSYRKLAYTLQIPYVKSIKLADLQIKVHEKLETNTQKPWLLIFDNVDESGVPPCPTKGGTVLVTSANIKAFENKNALFLKGLESEGKDFMEELTGQKDPEFTLLAQELKYSPLLLRQAASYIVKEEITPTQYSQQMVKKGFSKEMPYQDLLMICWEIASDALKKHRPEAYKWLLLSSFLDNKEIPKTWLQTFLDVQENSPEAQEILDFLADYGLVSSYKYDETFSMHGYFQEIIRFFQPSPRDTLKSLVPLMLEFEEIKRYNPTNPESAEAFEKIFSHVTSVLKKINQEEILLDEATILGLALVRYLIETKSNLSKAQEYLDKIKNLANKSPSHPRQGRIEFFYGTLELKKASDLKVSDREKLYESALAHFEKAYSIYDQHSHDLDYSGLEQNRDKCHQKYQKAISLEYQAQTLSRLNRLEEASKTFQQAYDQFCNLTLDNRHFDIARIVREQGVILLKQGKVPDAIEKIKEALKEQKIIYKDAFESHSTVAATQTALGEAYEALKSNKGLEQADKAYKEATTINEKAYRTKTHKHIARLYGKRANVAKQMGNIEQANEMQQEQEAIEKQLEENM